MAKRKRKKTAKTAKKATSEPQRGRPRKTAATTGGAWQGAVQNLQAALSALLAEREQLDAKIGALQQALAAVGASAGAKPAKGGPGRRRGGSLKEYVEQVLASNGGVMAVKDITDAVLAAGYPTRNRTLAKSVGIALTEMPNVKKVGRGKFQLK